MTQNTPESKRNGKWWIPAAVISILAILAVGYFIWSQENLAGTAEIPQVMEHREGCFLCHDNMTGFSASHDPKAIGCSSCHLGDPLSPDKDTAHKNMVKIPGNLDTVEQTCGTSDCHKDLSHKVTHSLMGTAKGLVSVNRYVFNEIDHPDGEGHLSQLGDSAADTHAKQLCVTCHLGFPKKEGRPIDQKSRGGGCTACHLDYSKRAERDLKFYHKSKLLPQVHPALNVKVDNDRCFGCHSRSARISLNYEGWHETQLRASKVKNKEGYRFLQDGRVLEKHKSDVHHDSGMQCIDCHSARDAMGDGNTYNHQEEQVESSCTDCHLEGKPETMAYHELDADSRKILQLRNRTDKKDRQYVKTQKTGRPLLNVFVNKEGKTVFQGKLDNKERPLNPPDKECTQIKGHDNMTCQSCHTAWAPTCIGCHTQYHPEKKHTEHYNKEKRDGAWREYRGPYLAVPPTLGIRKDTHTGKDIIDTFIPGMVMTIGGIGKDGKPDQSINGRKEMAKENYQVFRRMFAPTFSHTIQKKGRSCESCHSDSRALGFGEGTMTFVHPDKKHPEGQWKFDSKYAAHKADGLPQDAWTAPGLTRTKDTATRTGSRPFSKEEQERILRVGSCLECHKNTPENNRKIYNRFDAALKEKPTVCPRR